ncbi:hypothetical protein M3A49_01140 [Paraburkholderia sp. CNPSo 3076]|uniref:hypothetical protein n=1 Tax=Paraburkholderia sp. CNPSo 3076 TaxID=2940936 RepID=UPI00225847D0|nr:hypothetical protein [Paraburkholderia sp. CNPSo 3076]MCX5538113.1 hypothetical protein [Paraburkholderia sp. CNPSo 3076]
MFIPMFGKEAFVTAKSFEILRLAGARKGHRRGYPLMQRFHKPGDENRSVVIVQPTDNQGWLTSCSMDEACSFLNLFPADLMHAEACPAPPSVSKSDAVVPKENSDKSAIWMIKREQSRSPSSLPDSSSHSFAAANRSRPTISKRAI